MSGSHELEQQLKETHHTQMANAASATSANLEAASRGSSKLNQNASQKFTAANPSDRLPEYAANIQALVCVTAAAAIASKAAAALALLADRRTGGSAQKHETITSQYVAAAQAAEDVEQLLQDCQAAMVHQAAMRQEYQDALRKQRAAMQNADVLLQAEIKAAAEAPKERKRWVNQVTSCMNYAHSSSAEHKGQHEVPCTRQ